MKNPRHKRILILHDWLNVKDGGAERVLYELLDMFPEADVATLIYDKDKFGARVGRHRVKTSWLQYLPKFLKQRPELLLPFVKHATEHLPTKGYDVVIAASSAWVKNARLSGRTKMLVYCYSPARMLWDHWPQALTERTKNPLVRAYVTRLVSRLRLWDYYVSQESRREFVAISKVIARRIQKFYHRPADVIYSPVDIPPIAATNRDLGYCMVSVLAPYKNVELAIRAFMGTKRKLVIAGDGPDRERLEALADGSTNIRFMGRISEADKLQLLSRAQGFVFCNIEDFGIAPVEAIALGAPVIALRGGGLMETMIEGETAEFFDEPTVADLRAACDRAESRHWDVAKMHRQAQRFRTEVFRDALRTRVEKI